MNELLQDLENQVTCSICLEIFRIPKILPCFHTFCLHCLNRMAQHHAGDGEFDCPTCRTTIPVPQEGNFDSCTTSFLHNRLLEVLEIRDARNSETLCGNCGKKASGCSYCFDCSAIFCAVCLNAHSLLKPNAEHRVRALENFQQQDYQDYLQKPTFCTEKFHKSKPLECYCHECKQCMCHLCVVFNLKNHATHNIVHVQEAAEQRKRVLLADIDKLAADETTYTEAISKLEKACSDIDKNTDTAKREVKEFADQLVASIRRQERDMNVRLETLRATRQKKANANKTALESDREQLRGAVNYIKTLVESRTTVELLNKKDIDGRLEGLLNGPRRDIEKCTNTNIAVQFVPHKQQLELVGTEIKHLGNLDIGRTDSTKSILETKNLANILIGQRSSFTIITNTSESEQCYNPEDKIEVMFDPAVDVTDVQVTDSKTGRYDATFTPRVPGTYRVYVKIQGQNAANSPFVADVKSGELVQVSTYSFEGTGGARPAMLYGIAVSEEGELAVTDFNNDCILLCDKKGEYRKTIGCRGDKRGELDSPFCIAFSSRGEIVVADTGNSRIQVFNKMSGEVVRCFGSKGSAAGQFGELNTVSVDTNDRIIVTEQHNNRVQVFDSSGKFCFQFDDVGELKLSVPADCIAYRDTFIVADSSNHCIKIYDDEGNFRYKFGEQGSGDGEFHSPGGLAVDRQGNLLVCDSDNNRVQMLTLDGRFIAKTTCELQEPCFAAVMHDGKIAVTHELDSHMSVIQLITCQADDDENENTKMHS